MVGGAVRRPELDIYTGNSAVRPPVELRRDHVLVAAPRDGSPDKRLVRQRPIQLRSIDEVDTELERPPDRCNTLRLVGRAIKRRHPHTTQTDRRHLDSRSFRRFMRHPR